MTIRESNVEQYLVRKMKEAGGLCYKFVSPGCDGVPDRICIYRGQVIFVELKRPGEMPRKLQRHRAVSYTHLDVYKRQALPQIITKRTRGGQYYGNFRRYK